MSTPFQFLAKFRHATQAGVVCYIDFNVSDPSYADMVAGRIAHDRGLEVGDLVYVRPLHGPCRREHA